MGRRRIEPPRVSAVKSEADENLWRAEAAFHKAQCLVALAEQTDSLSQCVASWGLEVFVDDDGDLNLRPKEPVQSELTLVA